MKKEKLIAEFTSFPSMSNWVEGKVGKYKFQAKLFDNGSIFGIDKGRVSKLSIGNEGELCIVNYDRGWDKKPNKNAKPYFDAVMELLENAPKRFS